MHASTLALAATAAVLLLGCAHGGATSEDLGALRDQVRRLQQDREHDRRRLEALETQLGAMARRQQLRDQERAPEPAAAMGTGATPEGLSLVRLAPPQREPTPEKAEDDSFIFIVDRGDGSPEPSRPLRQARRSGPPAGGTDAAPPLPTAIELQDPAEPAAAAGAFESGMAALAAGDLDRAAQQLEHFLAAHPRDRRADNAGLALGDIFLQQEMPGKALRTWERVATDYPAGDAVPDALLRYGETCNALGRSAASRAAFTRLVQDYPGTEAATLASARLAEGK